MLRLRQGFGDGVDQRLVARGKTTMYQRGEAADKVDAHGAGRWHHHVVINATGDDLDLIRSLWAEGDNIEARPLRVDKEHNYETLARYLAKEGPERPGCRSWSYTRNAVKPEIETFTVPDDTQLQPPSGSTILRDVTERTDYSYYRVVKYLAAGWDGGPRLHTRRRRKR